MSQDNVRLALWISGAWGLIIIVIVGVEAIVHDGAIAESIVDTFSKVLFGLAGILGAITGFGKFFDTKQAVNASNNGENAPLPAPEPVSSPAGATIDGAGL